MLKTYELMERHFQWNKAPRKASEKQLTDYLLDRALRSQGLVSLDSACHLAAKRKPLLRQAIERRVKQGKLVPVAIAGAGKVEHWSAPETLAAASSDRSEERRVGKECVSKCRYRGSPDH